MCAGDIEGILFTPNDSRTFTRMRCVIEVWSEPNFNFHFMHSSFPSLLNWKLYLKCLDSIWSVWKEDRPGHGSFLDSWSWRYLLYRTHFHCNKLWRHQQISNDVIKTCILNHAASQKKFVRSVVHNVQIWDDRILV